MNDMITRRGFIRFGAAGALSALLLGQVPRVAWADDSALQERFIVPKARITVTDPDAHGVLETMEFNLDDCGEMNARAAKTSSMRRTQGADGVSTYTIEHALSLDKSYYKEEVQESDDTLEVYVRLSLGVLWGENKESIQIQRGTFCVSQTSPLVSYSNTGYAMMQKSHYMTDLFSGKETTIETGWPIDPFNEAADQYTCGGAVTGSGFNLMTGEELWYTIELYL